MQQPLVSILIPFKNVSTYLEKCLESIRNQEYVNWEVIAVNDHSSDSSYKIAKGFQLEDDRFKIFQNTGSGIIDALKLAYSKSTGNLISRMDADDYMASHRVSVMVQSLLTYGKGSLAIGQVKYFSENGINDGYQKYEEWLNRLTATGTNFSEIYKECVVPSPCWMVYRSDLENCDAFSPNRYPEDYDLAFRFYEKGLTCIPCTKTLHYWRDYQSRTSRTSAHYAQNYFLNIKLHYFLKLEYRSPQTLVLWGAGKKGKEIARLLKDQNVPFIWVCDNVKKIGKDIYGVVLNHYSIVQELGNLKIIITVANLEEQIFIDDYLNKTKLIRSKDYFFFC